MTDAKSDNLEQYAGCLLYRITDSGLEVLLVRPVGKGRKKWAIPQVVVSADEDFEEAARLAVAQETGVSADQLRYLGYADYAKRRLHCFYGRAHKGEIPHRLSLEIAEARFFNVREAAVLLDKRQKQFLSSLKSVIAFLKETA